MTQREGAEKGRGERVEKNESEDATVMWLAFYTTIFVRYFTVEGCSFNLNSVANSIPLMPSVPIRVQQREKKLK